MKKLPKLICVISIAIALTSCATTTGANGTSNLSVGSTVSANINNASYQSFVFNTGSTAPRTLKISSFLANGGFGAIFTGNPVAYPTVVIKDESGNLAGTRLISQKGVAPSMLTSAHVETVWGLQLNANKKYLLLVKAGSSTNHAKVSYSNTMTAVGAGTTFINSNLDFKPASSGSVDIQLN